MTKLEQKIDNAEAMVDESNDILRDVRTDLKGDIDSLQADWQEYAEQMMAVLGAEESIQNLGSLEGGYAQRPEYRPVTKFENRGLRLGHGVWDLVFKKR